MKLKSLVLFCLILVLSAATANATPLKVDVEDGADHQLSSQGNFKKGLKHSWEWLFGSGISARNITGISAQGLLAAHRITGLSAHEKSALKAARSLIAAYDKGLRKRRPHTQDIEFLAAAGYVIDAARWFGVIKKRWPAKAFVDYVIGRRRSISSMAGWDVASAIRAALAVGEVGYARGMLRRLIERRSAWDRRDDGGARQLSRASLLWTLAVFKRRVQLDADQARFAAGVLRDVLKAQRASGAWLDGEGKHLSTQTTAYAISGLSRWPGGEAAARRGRRWLQRVARPDKTFVLGGRIWSTYYTAKEYEPKGGYISTIQSEVLQALASGSI